MLVLVPALWSGSLYYLCLLMSDYRTMTIESSSGRIPVPGVQVCGFYTYNDFKTVKYFSKLNLNLAIELIKIDLHLCQNLIKQDLFQYP